MHVLHEWQAKLFRCPSQRVFATPCCRWIQQQSKRFHNQAPLVTNTFSAPKWEESYLLLEEKSGLRHSMPANVEHHQRFQILA